ncbi:MAG: urease accessory protein UreD, partial [Flavitalea sp.]
EKLCKHFHIPLQSSSPKILKLMQMSSSPGVLEGDEYSIKIHLDKDCKVSLETQAYQRLYKMKLGAIQHAEIELGENSFFEYLPHPTVPHAGASFRSSVQLNLHATASLVYGEIYTCGRKLCQEAFLFNSIHSEIAIKIDNRLLVRERLVIIPSKKSFSGIGLLEGFTHQGSMFIVDHKINMDILVDDIRKIVENQEAGVTKISKQIIGIRVLGYKAEYLFELFKNISELYKNLRKNE